MEIEKPSRRRRNHTEEFKQAVITACCEAGASVAGIALANSEAVWSPDLSAVRREQLYIGDAR